MASSLAAELTHRLASRALPDGGFAGYPGEPLRPEATAWATLALGIAGTAPELVARGRQRLVEVQLPDGGLSTAPLHPGTAWPTAIAVLAWQGAAAERDAQRRAVAHLLATRGSTFRRQPELPLGDDPSLPGWPWVAGTYSWVEPTSLALLALAVVGETASARFDEGRRFLLDRQISAGGWNYGNGSMFGRELYPAPESTGPALAALAGQVGEDAISKSLAYLATEIATVRTPIALGWSLLALGAWARRPESAARALVDTLARPSALADFDTVELALLLLADRAPRGLLAALPALARSAA
jgi:hypothetical protein